MKYRVPLFAFLFMFGSTSFGSQESSPAEGVLAVELVADTEVLAEVSASIRDDDEEAGIRDDDEEAGIRDDDEEAGMVPTNIINAMAIASVDDGLETVAVQIDGGVIIADIEHEDGEHDVSIRSGSATCTPASTDVTEALLSAAMDRLGETQPVDDDASSTMVDDVHTSIRVHCSME